MAIKKEDLTPVEPVELTPLVPGEEFELSPTVRRNYAINEYFKFCLQGALAADTGSRLPELLVRKAMDYAVAAYNTRVEELGADFEKEPTA